LDVRGGQLQQLVVNYVTRRFIFFTQNNVSLFIQALQPFVGPWPLSQVLDPIHSR
jgi:hypothetical protein